MTIITLHTKVFRSSFQKLET